MTATEVAGPPIPAGRPVDLPGRGRTWVVEHPGPGGAPTVVLLHGWAVTAAINWFPSINTLGRHYRVLAMDHRGHGRGIRSRRAFRLSDCADDVAALADVCGVERVIPVGYSMGGPIAQLTWHRHPDRVRGLVLCATSGSFRGGPGENLFLSVMPALGYAARVTPGVSRRWLASRLIGARLNSGPLEQWAASELRNGDPAALLEAGGALGRFSSAAWIGGVSVPAAVVVTERDNLVSPARQRNLAAAIPGATVHSVDGDHAACVSGARRFVPVLLEAVESVVRHARP